MSRDLSRRDALTLMGVGLLAAGASRAASAAFSDTVPVNGQHVLPPLPYETKALEPYIDAQTMQIHHDKHHAAYVANLNKALAGQDEWAKLPVEELLRRLPEVPEKIRGAVRNQGGGHANHTLFWQTLKPADDGPPSGGLAQAIAAKWGDYAAFQKAFAAAAVGQFGSGWAWLVANAKGQLELYNLPNQDSPLTQGHRPLLGLDVWEHAYYLKYQNRRADYVTAWWNVVNWPVVQERWASANG